MEFGPLSPIDGKHNECGEGDHAVKRDRQESVGVGHVELYRVESRHDDGDGNAQRNHYRGEAGSEPADRAMPAHFVYADQRRLGDEKDHPTREYGAVNPEQEGPWRGSVEETVIDRTTEAQHYKRGEQQRHREIEISANDPFQLGHRTRLFFRDRCKPDMFLVSDWDRHKTSSYLRGAAGIAAGPAFNSFDDSPFGPLDKPNQHIYIFPAIGVLFQLL